MYIQNIVRQLALPSMRWLQAGSHREPVYSCARLSQTQDYYPNTLYIGTLSEIPSLSAGLCYNFICVRDLSEANLISGNLVPETCNVITIPQGQSLDDLETELKKLFQEDARYMHCCNVILQEMNAGKDLQELTDLAYELVGNPIFMIDTDYCPIAMSNTYIPERPDLEEQRRTGVLDDANISNLKQHKIYEKIRQTNEPFYADNGKDANWLHYLIRLREIEIGEIAMVEINHKITVHDHEFLIFFSRIAASVMERDNQYQRNRGYMHSMLLYELLTHRKIEPTLLNFRLNQLRWPVTDDLFILTVYDNNTGAFDRRSQIISEQICRIFTRCRWTTLNSQLVFLLMQPGPSPLPFQAGDRLYTYLENNHLIASVSDCFHDITHAESAYAQCQSAYMLGHYRNPDCPIYYYGDYYLDHIADILSGSHDLTDFCDPQVLRVYEYDLINHTSYLETLKIYLQNITSPKDAAEQLYIHKNTLFYRLGKIKELFHFDLKDGKENFKIQLSIALLDYRDVHRTI